MLLVLAVLSQTEVVVGITRMTEEVLDSICGHLQARETKYKGMTRLLSPEKIENRRRRKVTVGFGKR
ncbi:hypothetical protein JHK87_052625 [Glycine soja]|nr:hypothetical protein JHK87_052625 [Glycine soja]